MTGRPKRLTLQIGAAMLVIVGGGGARVVWAAEDGATVGRVRSHSATVTTLIREGAARSATFRGLVDVINASDGVVYVNQGPCGHGVRSCLANRVTVAGPYRFLYVLINTRAAEWDLIGSIGHELRHAVEVLAVPGVNDFASMFAFYSRQGWRVGSSFETQAAVDAGMAVRSELRRTVRD
jgi:hypothetical protein